MNAATWERMSEADRLAACRALRAGTRVRITDPGRASLGREFDGLIVRVTGEVKGSFGMVGPYIEPGTYETPSGGKLTVRPGLGIFGGAWEREITPVAIRPGFVLSLSLPIRGGTTLIHRMTEAPTLDPESGRREEAWETRRIIADAREHGEAVALRASIRNGITALCYRVGGFGIMFSPDRYPEVRAAISEAQDRVAAFNARARTCRINLAAMPLPVVPNDDDQIRAIRGEVAAMLGEVNAAIRSADPERIRAAVNEVRDASRALAPGTSAMVKDAIDDARRLAREMTARVKAAGEGAAIELSRVRLDSLATARAAFLDLDDPDRVPDEIPPMPRFLDLASPDALDPDATPDTTRAIDLTDGNADVSEAPASTRILDV